LLRRTALAVALTLLALPLAGAGYEAWSARGAADRYPPPGRLVDVGDHALHLDVRGAGSPVVVLEAGSGETSLGWQAVADALAERTTVVAYDRAGYAWSEPSAEPRTGEAVVADLRAALDAAGLAGPYVVVGHSMGGLFARLLAERAPEDVAGLVLVDARPPRRAGPPTRRHGPWGHCSAPGCSGCSPTSSWRAWSTRRSRSGSSTSSPPPRSSPRGRRRPT